jgi:hypothetical protein
MLFSLFTTPSPTVDTRNDDAVADFVRAYAVAGFVDGGSRRR